MRDLLSLKNAYAGRRIFVIGNGPSLRRTPLDLLRGEHAIAMNRIAMLYDRTFWRPTFFVCTTTNVRRPAWKRDILRTIDLNVSTFAWDQLRDDIGDRPNLHWLHCTHGNEITAAAPDDWWSDDITQRVCKFGTSMLPAMQIAFYLGFTEIYVLGADLGFQRTTAQRLLDRLGLERLADRLDRNHFTPTYDTPGLDADRLEINMLAAHRLIAAAAKRRNVRVYNATLGGRLELYPRVDLRSVLGAEIPESLPCPAT